MTKDEQIVNALLLYGMEDMLYLSWMTQTVHWFTGIPRDSLELIAPTLEAIHDLLEAEYAFVGDAVVDEKGFTSVESWNLQPDKAVARIRERWNELEEPLRMYDVVWLELTEKGRKEAERLDEMGCDPLRDICDED